MLGIPTRSDVQDEEYRRSVVAEELRRDLHEFSWPTSTVFIHNHMNPHRSRGEDLDPSFVLEHYLAGIESYRQDLERGVSLGIVFSNRKKIKSSHHPNEYPYYDGRTDRSGTGTRKMALDERLVGVTDLRKPKAFRFRDLFKLRRKEGIQFKRVEYNFEIEFNPRDLAFSELAEYEKALRVASQTGGTDKEKLRRMKLVIEQFDDSANKRLLFPFSLVDSYNPKWPSTLERKAGTEANRLATENRRIADISDIFLRFDEHYIAMKMSKTSGHYIPAGILLNQDNPLTASNLSGRQVFRDNISHLLNRRPSFIFNGVEYVPLNSSGGVDSYLTIDDITPKQLVNILGVPVIGGKRIVPDEWASDEVDLVRRYREGDSSAANTFLERYSGLDIGYSRETPTSEKLEHLKYVLKLDKLIAA